MIIPRVPPQEVRPRRPYHSARKQCGQDRKGGLWGVLQAPVTRRNEHPTLLPARASACPLPPPQMLHLQEVFIIIVPILQMRSCSSASYTTLLRIGQDPDRNQFPGATREVARASLPRPLLGEGCSREVLCLLTGSDRKATGRKFRTGYCWFWGCWGPGRAVGSPYKFILAPGFLHCQGRNPGSGGTKRSPTQAGPQLPLCSPRLPGALSACSTARRNLV